MKKLFLTMAFMGAFLTAYGQGRVNFANTAGTLITTNNLLGATGNTAGPGQYTFGLYVGPVGTLEAGLVLNITGTNNAGAGRFTGGSPAPIAAPFDNTAALAFQIRSWSTFAGASYEAAFALAQSNPNVYLGKSAVGQVSPTVSPTGPAALFGAAPLLVTGWEMSPIPVPEPSSIALGLLGLGAIALFRRRK